MTVCILHPSHLIGKVRISGGRCTLWQRHPVKNTRLLMLHVHVRALLPSSPFIDLHHSGVARAGVTRCSSSSVSPSRPGGGVQIINSSLKFIGSPYEGVIRCDPHHTAHQATPVRRRMSCFL